MCLTLFSDTESEKFVERLRKAGKRGLFVYKEYNTMNIFGEFSTGDDIRFLQSPYRLEKIELPKKANKDLVIKSNRTGKKLTGVEKDWQQVYLGIHTYVFQLEENSYELFKVRVYYKDLVAVGMFSEYRSAVFLKITLPKEEIAKLLNRGPSD